MSFLVIRFFKFKIKFFLCSLVYYPFMCRFSINNFCIYWYQIDLHLYPCKLRNNWKIKYSYILVFWNSRFAWIVAVNLKYITHKNKTFTYFVYDFSLQFKFLQSSFLKPYSFGKSLNAITSSALYPKIWSKQPIKLRNYFSFELVRACQTVLYLNWSLFQNAFKLIESNPPKAFPLLRSNRKSYW